MDPNSKNELLIQEQGHLNVKFIFNIRSSDGTNFAFMLPVRTFVAIIC